ncbi:MAG TPA: carboxypeptidase regulatory-like domain-containing protein [Pyrinomonadaceae bacterium]|nr:carboxypeptidase regulatory-like domain-containing protein [Pyrinomonadaceae bacterium]
MNFLRSLPGKLCCVSLIVLLSAALVTAQQARGTLRGLITDELGAAIVGANVILTDASGVQKKTTTNGEGVYNFAGLALGKYTLTAAAPGFAPSENKEVDLTTARQTVDLTLRVTIEEKVTVAETAVSTEATNNANQTVIAGKDLDALPDDPDELAAALQALAGPSVGPNGGQIFIDGFTGGNLPSKDSIREIRINQNPFAAENDQPSARIDILTRPGTDKFRGGASMNFNDESLNSRNPFAVNSSKRTPFQIRQYDMNLSGPLVKKKASFFFNFGRVETDDNDLVRATVLDDDLNVQEFGQAFLVPRRNLFLSPRFDYAINTNNTLVVRYNYNRFSAENQGLGGFTLPERAFDLLTVNQNVQVTETAILNPTMINETRFQFTHNRNEQTGSNSIPALDVSGSFGSGGSQVGQSVSERTSWELTNFTAKQHGTHAIKFGGRVRHISLDDKSEGNFGGTWTFTGGFGLSSIERYQKTLQLQEQGFTPAQIRAAGGGATQFRLNAGNPFADVNQTDYGVFIQDDWRIRPNLTLSYGLRYEIQTNAHSKFDFAPRIAVAWSPGAANSAKPPKMVIRVGTGFFYNRFNESSTLQTVRFDGERVIQTAIAEPFDRSAPPSIAEQQLPNVAPIYALLNQWSPTAVPNVSGVPATQQAIWQVDPNLQIPTVYVIGTQVERQLPRNITMFVGFYNIRIVHVIRARDVNAPLPFTITELTPNGIRPDPTRGDINRYEASGQFNQRQFFVGFNSRFSRMFQLNGNYSLSKTTNDTDGQGGALFPMNSYDTSGEFGRSSFDIRHRFTIFGTVNLPWWKVVLNPFIIANTGPGFNITTGQDRNLDRQFNERPSFAAANADCNASNIACTRFGNFNLTPLPGEKIIPRNYGQAPGSFVVNLRISRAFAFGVINKGNAAAARPANQTATAGAGDTRPAGGPGGPNVAGGGGGGGARVAAIGPQGGGGGAAPSEKRYTLNVSINFQNLLNRVNLSTPVGNLSSPSFGESLGLGGAFGGFGGGGGSSGAGNRRIYAQVRLNF